MKYILVQGSYQATKLLTSGDMVVTDVLPGFVLNLDEVFADK